MDEDNRIDKFGESDSSKESLSFVDKTNLSIKSNPEYHISLWLDANMAKAEIKKLLQSAGFSEEEANNKITLTLNKIHKKRIMKISLLISSVILIIILLAFFHFYRLSKYEVIITEDGSKYHLDVSKEYYIPDKSKLHTLELNLSSELNKAYSENKKETYKDIDWYTFNWDSHWRLLSNSTDEDIIIEMLVQDIDNLIQSGKTAYSGKDAKAYYATKLIQYLEYDYWVYRGRVRTTRYPYETLFDQKGVCRETALLLAKIYTKQGYGTAIVTIPRANHAVTGIKCNSSNAVKGYCIVESTGERGIGEAKYSGGFWGAESLDPNIHFQFTKISDGETFTFDYN